MLERTRLVRWFCFRENVQTTGKNFYTRRKYTLYIRIYTFFPSSLYSFKRFYFPKSSLLNSKRARKYLFNLTPHFLVHFFHFWGECWSREKKKERLKKIVFSCLRYIMHFLTTTATYPPSESLHQKKKEGSKKQNPIKKVRKLFSSLAEVNTNGSIIWTRFIELMFQESFGRFPTPSPGPVFLFFSSESFIFLISSRLLTD